jgi:TPR repeat protein
MVIDFYVSAMKYYEVGRFKEAFEMLDSHREDPRCLYALGTMYYNGQGVERSFAQATQHYSQAAEFGVLPAQVSAGFAYANAMGVPEDFDKAAYYLKMAVAQGEAAAKITLAEIYAKGEAGGTRKEAAQLIREVLATTGGEEAYDVYTRYDLGNVKE